MDRRHTPTSNKRRLLLNAEPFGFGPTAAIADCFPLLRSAFDIVGYVGTGHTLDLQRRLPYDAIHDVGGLSGAAEEAELQRIFAGYDVMLTALDFGMAEKAIRHGLSVSVYDPLTWYWRELPPVLAQSGVQYLAQDFFGVRERLQAEAGRVSDAQIVSPIIPKTSPLRGPRERVLLNLGGLNNPFWTAETTLAYARLVVECFCRGVEPGKELIVIASNAAIAQALSEFGACNYTRDEMQVILGGAKYALMTPGLGNIYDAARYGTPTIWLPPANDSQGQQLKLLETNAMSDGCVDWHEILPGEPIDYSGDQQAILKQIATAVATASGDSGSRRALSRLLGERRHGIKSGALGLCSQLIARFGSGGTEQVADRVLRQAR